MEMKFDCYVIIGITIGRKNQKTENVLDIVNDEEQAKLGVAYYKAKDKYKYTDIFYYGKNIADLSSVKPYIYYKYNCSLRPTPIEGVYNFSISCRLMEQRLTEDIKTFSPEFEMVVNRRSMNDGEEFIILEGYFTQLGCVPEKNNLRAEHQMVMEQVNAHSNKIKLITS